MKYLKLFGALALLLSFPVFSDYCELSDFSDCKASGSNNTCTADCDDSCFVSFDLSTGEVTDWGGDCDWDSCCVEVSDGVWECAIDFECFEDSPTAVNARQSAVLVYSSFNSSQTSALTTGTLGTSEGTFADKEVVFVIDAETPHTNEVEIRPTWCK